MIWLLLGCPRSVAPELELDRTPAAAEVAEPGELEAWRAWLLHGDVLARRPRSPANLLDPGLASWRGPAAGGGEAAALWKAEAGAAGTPSLPLLRGARLAAAETLGGDPATRLAWVVPLADPGSARVDRPRSAFAWLGADADGDVLVVMERAVILGWLDAPGVAWPEVIRRLGSDDLADLALTPAGALLEARGRPPAGPATEAREALRAATELALLQAAADAPSEHEAIRARIAATGVTDVDVPAAMIERALPALVAGAGADDLAGLALVAQTGLRWRGRCADPPCGGFDRLPALAAAGRYGTEPAELAAAWRALAWKSAVDELYAAWGRPQAVGAMDRVAELVAANDPRALDRNVLLRAGPDAAWCLAVSRAVGGPEGTDRKAVFRALYRAVAREASEALARAPGFAEPLDRIARRARRAGE
jgi:hypothetical protein